VNVALCGAGTMGRGIALNALRCGHAVVIFDINADACTAAGVWVRDQLTKAVDKGLLTSDAAAQAVQVFRTTTSLDDCATADLVIEAVAERLDIKHDLFRALEERCAPTTILASNTSSISIASLARCLVHQDRFVGLHFFNPAHIMKLVEVIKGPRTSQHTLDVAVAFARELGKTTVVARDVPGFIVNRVARNYYNEAQRIAMEQAAQPEQIDRCMRAIGFKMGPFELMDLIGVDVNLDVTKSMYAQYFNEPRFTPSLMQQQYVDAGLHGKKTNGGFYPYES
jgi:3-hydroxybutyryl-CoA dehydrogenase